MLACCLLVATLVAAGCGDDNEGGPAPSPTSTVAAVTATPMSGTATAAPTDTPGGATPSPTPTAPVMPSATPSGTPPPNIVFIVMDDVGIDQLEAFGLGQGALAATPNLDALAEAGVRFPNTWSMPECSPSRATIFTGRYPLRTGVTSALIPNMLPQAQVSPYETTLPRLLAGADYASAMVGKYHLGNRNPAGNCAPRTLGFDYFEGNMEAGPPAIDFQAGHVEGGAASDLMCGFDQREAAGHCYFQDGSCRSETVPVPAPNGGTESQPVTGRSCMEAGGIFVEETGDCQATSSVACPDGATGSNCVQVGSGAAVLDFERSNAYYAWPQTIESGTLSPDTTTFTDAACGEPPLDRVYMTLVQTGDSIDWYNEQSGPRMLTVSYNSIHTPYQQAPRSLSTLTGGQTPCGDQADDRLLAIDMLSSMDYEIGRLLASLNLATLDENGTIQTTVDDNGYRQIPELRANNTMVVVVGDNGSFFKVTKLPYDPLRSKGTVYQTGVTVPLIIAGPLVEGPTGREEKALINLADLYDLFAEIAGIDPAAVVPPAHTLDAQPVLAYLTNPDQTPIREFNFTQLGPGVFDSRVNTESPVDPAARNWPCVFALGGLGSQCNDVIADTQSFCHTNGGVWWGPTDDPDSEVVAVLGQGAAVQGEPSCCAVIAALEAAGMTPPVGFPIDQYAVRNQTYKLVRRDFPDCANDDGHYPPDKLTSVFELYDLTPTGARSNPLGLDVMGSSLLCDVRGDDGTATCLDGSACDLGNPTSCLTSVQMMNYDRLQEELQGVLRSQTMCEGDGNLDQRIDQRDADGVSSFSSAVSPLTLEPGGQSYFDLNTDTLTNETDAQIVTANFGTDCIGPCRRADLNHDGYVDEADAALLEAAFGPCDLCGSDLNDDGQVDDADRAILEGQIGCSSPTATPTQLPTQPTPTPFATPTPILCNAQCVPDATRRQCGCGLYVPGETTLPPDSGVSCETVCQEYAACQRLPGPVEIGYTCDATLCTTSDVGLATQGCYGIQACDVSDILEAERAAGCSCCASQLCDCIPSATTNRQVRALDIEQRQRGETPQCDINGTLCGG